MSQQSVTKAYASILSDLSCDVVETDGILTVMEPTRTNKERRRRMTMGEGATPVVVPNKEALKQYVPDDTTGGYPFMIYHPAHEARDGKESFTLKRTVDLVRHNFNYKMLNVTLYLTSVLSDSKAQDSLKNQQLKFIKPLAGSFNSKTGEFIAQVLAKFKPSRVGQLMLVPTKSIKTTHDGMTVEALYQLGSPLLKELEQASKGNQDKVWGIKVPAKKHVDAFIKLLNHILPDLGVGGYDSSSTSRVAPRLECVLNMFKDVTTRLDDIIRLYPDLETLVAEDKLVLAEFDWVEEMENLASVKSAYPLLQGNGLVETSKETAKISTVEGEKVTETHTIVNEDKPADEMAELLAAAGANTTTEPKVGLKAVGVQKETKPKTIVVDGMEYVLKDGVATATKASTPTMGGGTAANVPATMGGPQANANTSVFLGGQTNAPAQMGGAPQSISFVDSEGNIQVVQQMGIMR